MKNRIEEFENYMRSSAEEKKQKITEMVRDGRADEARAVRAGLNMYEVMTALFGAALKKTGEGEECFSREFHILKDNVTGNWKRNLEAAKEHGDAEKVMIEESKLQTVEEIVRKFDSLF